MATKKNKPKQSDHSIILDNICWSHSSITTFARCPKCFYLQYIKCLPSDSGFFGEYGSLCHTILEKYAKKELEIFELSKYYKDNFATAVPSPAPPNKYVDLKEKYFNAGLEFFDNFEGYDDVKILGIENKYNFNVKKYSFTGLIDLETEDIIDYKTKGELHVNKLTKKHSPEDFVQLKDGRYIKFEDIIQLLLYCVPYKTKHKRYPNNLVLDMIKINDKYVVEFKEELLNRAMDWVENTIKTIYKTNEFKTGDDISSFWCNWVCSQRYNCNDSERYVDT